MTKFEKLLALENTEILPEDADFIRSCLSDDDALIRCEAVSLTQDIDILLSMCDDADDLVRTEVYDTLSFFLDKRIPVRLKEAILSDPDETARSYAIMAWADTQSVHAPLHTDFSEQITFIQAYQKSETSDGCHLACAYALYQFRHPGSLQTILSYLHHDDYHLRCFAVNCLDSADEKDMSVIYPALKAHLQIETARAVSSSIEKFLKSPRFHGRYI